MRTKYNTATWSVTANRFEKWRQSAMAHKMISYAKGKYEKERTRHQQKSAASERKRLSDSRRAYVLAFTSAKQAHSCPGTASNRSM